MPDELLVNTILKIYSCIGGHFYALIQSNWPMMTLGHEKQQPLIIFLAYL